MSTPSTKSFNDAFTSASRRDGALTPYHEAQLDKLQEIADAIVGGTLSASTQESQPVTVAMVRESLMRQDAQNYSRSCEALAAVQSAALEDIGMQTLLITGDEDPVAPPSTAHDMSRRLPKARVVVLSRCGHWTPFERHVECANLLEESLRRA